MTESQILAHIMLAVGSRADARIFRMNVGTARDPFTKQVVKFGVPGMGDLLVLHASGRFLWIEVKSETGRLRPEQIRFRDAIHALAGPGHYVVARSAEDAIDAVEALA